MVNKDEQGRLQGGSGRNLRPVWLKGEKNSTIKGGRIPPSRGGEEFPQIYGSHIIYKFFLAHGSHLQLGVRTSLVSYLTARCTVHGAPLLRQGRGLNRSYISGPRLMYNM